MLCNGQVKALKINDIKRFLLKFAQFKNFIKLASKRSRLQIFQKQKFNIYRTEKKLLNDIQNNQRFLIPSYLKSKGLWQIFNFSKMGTC